MSQSQDENMSALLGDAPPQESLSHPNSIKKILERKTRLKQWPIEKKLEKLSFYSRCTYNTECGCSGKLDNSQILYNVWSMNSSHQDGEAQNLIPHNLVLMIQH